MGRLDSIRPAGSSRGPRVSFLGRLAIMVQALAARLSPWCLAIAFLVAGAPTLRAQTDAGKAAAKKDVPPAGKGDPKAAPNEAEAKDDEAKGVVNKDDAGKQETSEVFEDPRVKPLLKNTFKEFPEPRSRLTNPEQSALRNMAAGIVGVNRPLIDRFLDQSAADLTKHANIKAVIDPDPGLAPGNQAVRAIERASQFMMELLVSAQDKKNDAFLREYVPALFTKLSPLLEGHLLSRIEAVIILGSAATPQYIDLFIKLIDDPRQVVWVKHWAAVALTKATGRGRVTLEINKAIGAASALLGFLEKEPATPWPVKLRVLEALGSIRLASTAGPQGKPDVAALAAQILSDPGNKIEVRSWAAWTLGLLTIPATSASYNIPLEAYEIGRLAADLGDRIVADYDQRGAKFTKQTDYARYVTGLLIYQVYPGLGGLDEVPNSGLLNSRHPAALAARPLLTGLDDQIKKLGRSANELLTAGGGQVKGARDDLAARVVELKSFLDKNRPANAELFPGGPKLPVNPQQVPGAAAARVK